MRTDWFAGVHVLKGTGLGEECGGWEEGAGLRKEPGAPRGAADPLGLGGGSRGGPHPCLPSPPQDTDDKWACVLGRQRRLHRDHIDHPALGATQLCRLVPPPIPPPSQAPGLRRWQAPPVLPLHISHLGVCVGACSGAISAATDPTGTQRMPGTHPACLCTSRGRP